MAVNPEKTYDGRPCKHCGATLRWRCDRKCVACERPRSRAWKQEKRANDPEWLEREQGRNREWYWNLPNTQLRERVFRGEQRKRIRRIKRLEDELKEARDFGSLPN